MKLFPIIISFLGVYEKIDFKNIKTIITENDLYPIEYAVIQNAKEKKIRTIKVDYFMIDDIYLNNINCEYYFYPNDYHRSLLAKFPANRNVQYVEGGFPSWDKLNQYSLQNTKICASPKIIAYFTQYVLVNEVEKQYIHDILEFVNSHEGNKLVIKVHPRHEGDYSSFAGPNVEILKGDGYVSYDLISQAAFTFSIFSIVTLEAKHICRNSYYINYDIEHSNYPIDYKVFGSYLDIVTSKQMLFDVLDGKYQPTEIERFIDKFNPPFPYTCEKIKKILL